MRKIPVVDLSYKPLETADRCEHGCDHGADGIVLVRVVRFRTIDVALDGTRQHFRCDTELVWRKGCLVWNGNYMPRTYHPAELQVLRSKIDNSGLADKVFSGGRLTHKRIVEQWPLISRMLGVNIRAEDVRLGETLHVTKDDET